MNINHELNRFLQEEMPQCIYIVKLPKPQSGGANKTINHSATLWQSSYIRKRLEQKCREHSVEVIQVIGKVNTARNVKKRGQGEGRLNERILI